MLLKDFVTRILDTLFPAFCLGCGAPSTFLCDICLSKIPLRHEHRCPSCEQTITPAGQRCSLCVERSSLDGVFAATYYRVPVVARAIHTYKYRFIPALALPLGDMLSGALQKTNLALPDIILPVPLHTRRLRFRGFNQSELLAQRLGAKVAPGMMLPVFSQCLLRTRFTKPQVRTTSREERVRNLQGAFSVSSEAGTLLNGKSIWIIDDVTTTGGTLEECALVLKQAGARHVFGIVIAKQE